MMVQNILTAVLTAAAAVFLLWKAVRFFSGKTKGCCSSCPGCRENVKDCCHCSQFPSEGEN